MAGKKKKQDDDEIQVLILFEKDNLRLIRYPEDEEERDEIYFQIFTERDDQGFYDDTENMSEKMLALLDKANKGDKGAARTFLNLRSGKQVQHETFQIYTLEQ